MLVATRNLVLCKWRQNGGNPSRECKSIKTVAMQSTGVYWIAVYDILEEAGLEVYLVNAPETKNLGGNERRFTFLESSLTFRLAWSFRRGGHTN